jgi:hypothetical protein
MKRLEPSSKKIVQIMCQMCQNIPAHSNIQATEGLPFNEVEHTNFNEVEHTKHLPNMRHLASNISN